MYNNETIVPVLSKKAFPHGEEPCAMPILEVALPEVIRLDQREDDGQVICQTTGTTEMLADALKMVVAARDGVRNVGKIDGAANSGIHTAAAEKSLDEAIAEIERLVAVSMWTRVWTV